ncbi:4745_t:CDS:2 [Funneliformis mosseae]|uniref:4745_t:CDS:1 n=1 Tax=Funneliformis mosseae TaxID=27381 RepID=A0A9N9F6Q6_FUNMO|nr:4745_t:CDS:2 [Funneliformis mosseae]
MNSSLSFRLNASPICLICLLCENTYDWHRHFRPFRTIRQC